MSASDDRQDQREPLPPTVEPLSPVEARLAEEEARQRALETSEAVIETRRRGRIEAETRRISDEMTRAAQERLRTASRQVDAKNAGEAAAQPTPVTPSHTLDSVALPSLAQASVLVPLDGSTLAEAALPVAERIARALGRPLVLARVIPPTTWAFAGPNGLIPPEAYQQMLDEEEQTAAGYVDQTADRLRARGFGVVTQVERGDPAFTLLELEARFRIGLVVMATHGRTGLARTALGSIADRLVRGGQVPILLLRPRDTEEQNHIERLESALVPLDGSMLAERALPLAAQLAGSVVKQITLVRVLVPPIHTGERINALHYLDMARIQLAKRLAGRDCTISRVVLEGDAAERIVASAREDCDLIIMATHGTTGVRRWAVGSVADRVLHDAATTLLLVHPASE